MTNRQAQFLKQMIESYLVSAEPVASSLLAEHSNVSSATVRNEMAQLETEGYITQPHTSAGRVPTTAGYKYYLDHFVQLKKPSASAQERMKKAVQAERASKELAKTIADLSHQAVLLAFSKNDYFYTGISQLFAQPEFQQTETIISLSSVLDAFDQTLTALYEYATDDVQVLIGEDNPFSAECSLLISKASISDKEGVMAILGPQRMHYGANMGLLDYSKQLLA